MARLNREEYRSKGLGCWLGKNVGGTLGDPVVLEYELTCDQVTRTMNRAVFEITSEGRPTVMLVPITLLNGNVASLTP